MAFIPPCKTVPKDYFHQPYFQSFVYIHNSITKLSFICLCYLGVTLNTVYLSFEDQ